MRVRLRNSCTDTPETGVAGRIAGNETRHFLPSCAANSDATTPRFASEMKIAVSAKLTVLWHMLQIAGLLADEGGLFILEYENTHLS